MPGRVPTYYGVRIYLTSSLLFLFLILPFMGFLGLRTVPQVARERGIIRVGDSLAADSLRAAMPDPILSPSDSLSEAERAAEEFESSGSGLVVTTRRPGEEEERVSPFRQRGPFASYFQIGFFLALLSYLLGFIYNHAFKRFFKRKRRGKQIPGRLSDYCKKWLLRTPLVNSLLIIIPNLGVIVYSLIFFLSGKRFENEIESEIFLQFFFLTLVATLLQFLFAYYWQRHRVHIRYIEHLFSPEELKSRIFKGRMGRIRDRYLIASAITTFLPLLVVLVYLLLSLTSLRDLHLSSLNTEQQELLIGPWAELFNEQQEEWNMEKIGWLFYVNAGDALLMIIGICNGIFVSFIYLLLFIRWTNRDITVPVRELLRNIRNTRTGETERYTLVRSNDEIGELAEGYNEMTRKIHEHVEHISRMNRDLEKTVEERTREVVLQKEEIEAQKEEIEAQLDLATQQRDTISSQKEQILDSIRYAEKIQSAILPPSSQMNASVSDHFILFKPRDIVSGDYYWNSFRDGKLLLAVADCTGHGVPGAFLSVLGISSMNEIVNRLKTPDPAHILDHLRTFVIHSLHQTGTRGEAQDGIEIALCIIDPDKKVVEFSGANRPLYLIRSFQGRKEAELLHIRGDRMPIGIYEHEPAPFTTKRLNVEPGDSIYLFSDGYVDQLGGPKRKTFRSVHFRELLMEIRDLPMEQQKEVLLSRHEDWRGRVEQIDDILVAGIRI